MISWKTSEYEQIGIPKESFALPVNIVMICCVNRKQSYFLKKPSNKIYTKQSVFNQFNGGKYLQAHGTFLNFITCFQEDEGYST